MIGLASCGGISINDLAGIVTPFDIAKERHFFFPLPTNEGISEKKPRYSFFIKNVFVSLDNKTTTFTFKTALDLNNYVSRRDLQNEENEVSCIQLPIGLLKSGGKGVDNFAEGLKKRKMLIDEKLVDFIGYSFWAKSKTSYILRSISWEPEKNVMKSKIIRRLEDRKIGCDIKLPNLLHCFDVRDFITFESALMKSNELLELKRLEALLDLDPQTLALSILNEQTSVPTDPLDELDFILEVYHYANPVNQTLLPSEPKEEKDEKILLLDDLFNSNWSDEDELSLEQIFNLATFRHIF